MFVNMVTGKFSYGCYSIHCYINSLLVTVELLYIHNNKLLVNITLPINVNELVVYIKETNQF